MRAKEARQIAIWAFLKQEGYHPSQIKKDGKELWYRNPLRQGDSSPSFSVNTVKNLRYDFGMAKGGNALDLVCELKKLSIKQALAFLSRCNLYRFPDSPTEITKKSLAGKKEKGLGAKPQGFEVLQLSPICSQELINYLAVRKINLAIAKQYLSEIAFKPVLTAKSYKALAWACWNGFEVRNAFFKGFVGLNKSFIPLNLKNDNSLSIFEGYMDFLAFLSFFKLHRFMGSVIILNSINLRNKALSEIQKYRFSKVYLFLDNDQAGCETKDFFKQHLNHLPIVDKSNLYEGYKDFNQMLIEH